MSDEWEEQRSNYERYRFLVLNQFKRVSEHDALAAIEVNEMYLIPGRPSSSSFIREKAKSQAKAAIGYRYDNDSEECVSEDEQARRDEQLLTDYLRDDEEDEGDKSEEEYGNCHLYNIMIVTLHQRPSIIIHDLAEGGGGREREKNTLYICSDSCPNTSLASRLLGTAVLELH